MLLKKNRLNTKNFERVFNQGEGLKSKTYFIKILENDRGYIRVGVAVAKKAFKNAVEKNKHKRVLRHLMNEVLQDKKVGYDVIIIANQNIINQTFGELQKEAYELLQKTNIFN